MPALFLLVILFAVLLWLLVSFVLLPVWSTYWYVIKKRLIETDKNDKKVEEELKKMEEEQ